MANGTRDTAAGARGGARGSQGLSGPVASMVPARYPTGMRKGEIDKSRILPGAPQRECASCGQRFSIPVLASGQYSKRQTCGRKCYWELRGYNHSEWHYEKRRTDPEGYQRYVARDWHEMGRRGAAVANAARLGQPRPASFKRHLSALIRARNPHNWKCGWCGKNEAMQMPNDTKSLKRGGKPVCSQCYRSGNYISGSRWSATVELALARQCPVCGAPAGQGCHSVRSGIRCNMHKGRKTQ